METLTNEQKKNILNRILGIIIRVSDIDYQHRVWIRGEGPEVDDFGEIVCYYSTLTDSVFENYSEYGISDIQFPVIKKFHDSFQEFSEDNDWPQFFIDTPEWIKITEMAKDVLRAFDCTKEKIHLAIEESARKQAYRKQRLQGLFNALICIYERKEEDRVSIFTSGPVFNNFSEVISYYFNNIDSILKECRDYEISIENVKELRKFHEEFAKYWKGEDSPQLCVGTPEWTKITEMARDVLTAFHCYSQLPQKQEYTTERKKHILDQLLEAISDISDKDYQRRVWIRGEGPEVDDFGEAVCNYSYFAEFVFENYIDSEISETQLSIIKKFHDAFEEFWEDNDWPHLFIDTPEWTEITEMAKDVLRAFDCTKEKLQLALQESYKKYVFRKQRLEGVLNAISRIYEKKDRERRWMCADGPSYDSFSEAVSFYLNNVESILEEYRDYDISIAKLIRLNEFNEEFVKFWKNKDTPRLFVGTPEWIKIIEMAKDVLIVFHYYNKTSHKQKK